MRPIILPLAAALLLLGACTEAITSPASPPSSSGTRRASEGAGCDPTTAIIECPSEPGLTITGWPFFAPPNDVMYEAPNDPSPGAAGVWLGSSVTPSACFNDQNPAIVDADHDWLDDRCEVELAKGFAPRWSMGIQDGCPDGEPAWGAKYFPAAGRVRIAYLPSYYDDCGEAVLGIGGGHPGDSEMAMVEVGFNAATQHWEFRQMWLSAHSGTAGDRSQWVDPVDASFSLRYLGHPYIAVSANKHANYKSDSKCNNTTAAGFGEGDYCYGSIGSAFRFPIDAARNVGSRFTDLMGCVGSVKRFAGNGRTECYYTRKSFAGWHTGATGETAYFDQLNSDKFENRFGDWGPGPSAWAPPSPPPDDPPVGGCADPRQLICDP